MQVAPDHTFGSNIAQSTLIIVIEMCYVPKAMLNLYGFAHKTFLDMNKSSRTWQPSRCYVNNLAGLLPTRPVSQHHLLPFVYYLFLIDFRFHIAVLVLKVSTSDLHFLASVWLLLDATHICVATCFVFQLLYEWFCYNALINFVWAY